MGFLLIPIGVNIDMRAFDAAAKRALRYTSNLKPVWKKLKDPLKADQYKHIEKQIDIRGAKFKPLAQSTKARRLTKKSFTKKGRLRKPAARKLNKVLSKRLVSATKTTMDPTALEMRRRVHWMDKHQGGGTVGRGSMLPARAYLYIDQHRVNHAARLIIKGTVLRIMGIKK